MKVNLGSIGRFGLALLLVAGLLLAASLPAQSPNPFQLPNGQTFYKPANPVENLRTVKVPGSSLELYLWQEKAAGGKGQSFFAITEAGKARGRVRATTYDVRLRHHSFDPREQGPPAASPALAARQGNRLHLVQFETTPLPEYRQQITELGGTVLGFLADHTFIVEAEPQVRAQVQQLPYVRWMGPYHPMYRLEKVLWDALEGRTAALEPQRYSILLGERGNHRQAKVAELVERLGATVDMIEPAGLRVEATLTQDQLLEVVHSNDVEFVDRWGGPGETDMNIVRDVGGADYVEGLTGWSGEGVRGEIFDTELKYNHVEFSTMPILHSNGWTCGGSIHGTACYSINFAQGVDPDARGMVPDGQGIFYCYKESTQFGGSKSRYDITAELVDPAGPYRAVWQTASVGSTRTRDYTTISVEVDDYLFLHQLLSTQSQSNAGNQDSRPQAWAKNIVAVGGIRHLDTATRCDDYWGGGASTGPAADGRIKPDLSYFYDSIRAAYGESTSTYTSFGGTSAATPETAGHFGIMFQMWHNGVWTGHGGGADVFDSRPHMATAKALLVNTAYRYDWTNPGSCDYGDADRFVQGWGTPDVKKLYDRAAVTSIIDETDVIVPLEVKSYEAQVIPGETELAVTMVYTDPAGTAGAQVHRINDLSLKVTSPSAVSYWGNNGLDASNWSTSGGSSNTVDTVENVFVQNPEPGIWTIEIYGDEIVEDAHTETPQLDADFALVVGGGSLTPCESTCGDGVAECWEVCDGGDLGTTTCADFGCSGGTLACNAGCTGFDTSGCTDCVVCNFNGTCEVGEDCLGCSDCASGSVPGASCGNGVCEAGDGENCVNCAADCNGKQGGKPSGRFCCGDGGGTGPVPCTDSRCSTGGWSCTDVPADPIPWCCGLYGCETGESCSNCALDCSTGPEICTDDIDNDCDGSVDCDDSDCSSHSSCTGNEQ